MTKRTVSAATIFSGAALSLVVFCSALKPLAFEVPIEQREQMIDGRQTLVKVYEVSPETNPKTLIEDDFVQHGYLYGMTSITKDALVVESIKQMSMEHSVTSNVSKETDARDHALKEMPPYIEYNQDGYVGKLYPVLSTLEGKEASRKTGSGQKTITKTYAYMHNDDSLIPKEVDGHQLISLSWREGGYSEDSAMSGGYTATATYAKKYTYSSVTGWVHTMQYQGEVCHEREEHIQYTVTYTGEKIVTEEPGFWERLFGSKEEKGEQGTDGQPVPEIPASPSPDKAEAKNMILVAGLGLLATAAVGVIGHLSAKLLKSGRVELRVRDELSGDYKKVKTLRFRRKDDSVMIDPALVGQAKKISLSFHPDLSEDIKGKIVTVKIGSEAFKEQIGDAGGMDYVMNLDLASPC